MCQISIMLNGVCLILYMTPLVWLVLWFYWCIGIWFYWFVGLLVYWSIGLLVYRCIGQLVYGSMALLVCWSVGLLVYWSVGLLVSIHIERRQYLSICDCGFPHHILFPIRNIMLLAIQ
jgi:hypothetical protein